MAKRTGSYVKKNITNKNGKNQTVTVRVDKDEPKQTVKSGVIELKESPSFETIKEHFPKNKEKEITFMYDGKKIVGQRKNTYKGRSGKLQELKTSYLHIWLQTNPRSSSMVHYKENKDGSFTQQ